MSNGFRVGLWLVQPSLNTISQNGTSNRLEPKVMEVLVCLSRRAGEAIPKEELLQTVWPDTFVSDDVLKRSISELRRVFQDDARQSRIIETIPKRGYRLVAHVEPMNGAAASIATSTDQVRKLDVSGRGLRIGIAIGIAAAALLVALVGLVPADIWRKLPGKGIVPQIRSVAVLPLKNLSGDPEQKYFAEGMTPDQRSEGHFPHFIRSLRGHSQKLAGNRPRAECGCGDRRIGRALQQSRSHHCPTDLRGSGQKLVGPKLRPRFAGRACRAGHACQHDRG
ncbi:MAG: hypothetical protein DMG84_20550 [Acidobacteria bacterium]|nr:MAG: hypothetical protein DMG84_20550 [Acidobacteriota bacterium]